MSKIKKIIVFDLDETLGYFTELGIIQDAIISYTKNKRLINNQVFFNNLFNLFPFYLRPKISEILKYVIKEKNNKNIDKIVIYTNNQGPKAWVKMIQKYIETHITKNKTFNQIIHAYEVNGVRVEKFRTSHMKKYSDLVKCSKLDYDVEVFFIDDSEHKHMINDNVYYFQIHPYKFSYNINEITNKIYSSDIIKINESKEDFKIFMDNFFKLYNHKHCEKTNEDYNIDKIVSKHLLSCLKEF